MQEGRNSGAVIIRRWLWGLLLILHLQQRRKSIRVHLMHRPHQTEQAVKRSRSLTEKVQDLEGLQEGHKSEGKKAGGEGRSL